MSTPLSDSLPHGASRPSLPAAVSQGESDGSAALDRRFLLGAAGLAGVAALGAMTSRAHAGPLNPPAGAVSATGKPIGEIEPRIAVNATNTPGDSGYAFILNTPGSYYLTGNIAVGASFFAPVLCVEGVTLDLNGFTISGTNAYGVDMFGRCRLFNGTIVGFGTGVSSQAECIFEDLRLLSPTSRGIRAGEKAVIRRCTVKGNPAVGIECIGDYALVEDCWIDGIGSPSNTGIYLNSASTVRSCRIGGTGTGARIGNSSRAERCSIDGCNGLGISAASRAVIDACTVSTMGVAGVCGFDMADGCTLARSVAAACPIGARASGGGTRIADCDFDGNTTAVKIASSGCIVDNCRFTRNASGVDMTNVSNNYVNRCLFLGNTSSINVNVGGNWYPTTALGGVNAATNPLASVIG